MIEIITPQEAQRRLYEQHRDIRLHNRRARKRQEAFKAISLFIFIIALYLLVGTMEYQAI